MPDPVSNMIFERHNSYQQLELTPQADKRNIFNTLANVVTPEKNKVILFPSSLQHLVEVNSSGEPRYSIRPLDAVAVRPAGTGTKRVQIQMQKKTGERVG